MFSIFSLIQVFAILTPNFSLYKCILLSSFLFFPIFQLFYFHFVIVHNICIFSHSYSYLYYNLRFALKYIRFSYTILIIFWIGKICHLENSLGKVYQYRVYNSEVLFAYLHTVFKGLETSRRAWIDLKSLNHIFFEFLENFLHLCLALHAVKKKSESN